MKIDDSGLYKRRFSSVCSSCAHWQIGSYDPPTCRAFVDGIPDEIWTGKNNHRKPFKGDNGITFKLREV